MLVVLVNGLPGAGKTTLARGLGRALRLPVFTKDAVKETLADHLPGDVSPEWSRALGAAAGETLWTLLADAPGGAVLEAPWLAHLRHLALAGITRAGVAPESTHEVWCDVPIEVARDRYVRRAANRHPIHRDTLADTDARFAAWAHVAVPLNIGTVHRVDTTEPWTSRRSPTESGSHEETGPSRQGTAAVMRRVRRVAAKLEAASSSPSCKVIISVGLTTHWRSHGVSGVHTAGGALLPEDL